MIKPITAPGVYDIPAEVYHADPCFEPSLSSGIAKTLLGKSPAHAKLAHPRLNPDHQPENAERFDLGSAAHALMLGDPQQFEVIDADDWRTKAAKEARDAAREAGRIPLLARQWDEVCAMVAAGRMQLAAHPEANEAFNPDLGASEQTLVWEEGGIWCRARLDWKPHAGNVFYDYKTTGGSADPAEWARTCFNVGTDIQAGFYRRGIAAVLGIENAHFRFVVQETSPPYALSVVELDPYACAIADRKADVAIRWWRWCMTTGHWPGFPARVAYIEMPPWEDRRWTEREEREQLASAAGEDLMEMALRWQAPTDEDAERVAKFYRGATA